MEHRGVARKANFLKKILNGDKATKTSSFLKRKPTLKKKAMELETLCGIEVCVVCFDPNGKLVDTWPENEDEVKKRCSFYMGLNDKDKKELSCFDFLQHKKKKLMNRRWKLNEDRKSSSNVDSVISSLSMDGLSGDELRDPVNGLETKIKSFKDRIDYLVLNRQQQQKQKQQEDEIEKEKDLFSHLENIQILQGPTTTQFNNYEQSLGNLEENYYNNQLLIDNSYLYYNMGFGAEQMQMVNSSNNCLINYNSNYQRPHSIYDAVPISQAPNNLDSGNYDSFTPSFNYVGPVWFNY